MSEIQVGTHVFFGFGNKDLPKLPAGWVYIERPGHWVLALSPNDNLYLVSREVLYLHLGTDKNSTRAQMDAPIKIADL